MTLESDGFTCANTDRGRDGIYIAAAQKYDIIVLDLMLPDIDGYKVLSSLRGKKNSTPVLMLSGFDDADKKIDGLKAGADDFLGKPFNARELIARARAIIRRSERAADTVVKTGKVSVNLTAHTVDIGGRLLRLASKESSLLELLSKDKGKIVSRATISDHLYPGTNGPNDLRIIDVFVSKLRKKLSRATDGETHIDTLWKRGYVLRDPV